MLYPLKFTPIYKENIWGGNTLQTDFNRKLPSNQVGESWEVACHPHGMSVVSEGMLKGYTLGEIFEQYGEALLGPNYEEYKNFPLLVKLIDAKKRLSLQVHPDDLYAGLLEDGDYGKCEMWYVLKAKPGAKLAIGLKEGVTKNNFIEGLLKQDLESCINEVEVKAGDVFNIPAGLVHAIEEDIMIAEIQQNSDTVYRGYDWNRIGLDGEPRELHVAKALGCIDFNHEISTKKVQGLKVESEHLKKTILIANHYFAVEKYTLIDSVCETTDFRKMMILLCVKGSLWVRWQGTDYNISPGETILLPASLGDYTVTGKCEYLKAYIPDIEQDIIQPLASRDITNSEIYAKIAMG